MKYSIERTDTNEWLYWIGRPETPTYLWTRDFNKAMQFNTSEVAERRAKSIYYEALQNIDWIITEHEFVNKKQPLPENNRELYNMEQDTKTQPEKELTFGQKLVGLTFNPSGDEKVNKAKQLCAELADLLWNDTFSQPSDISDFKINLHNHAIGEILNAQMNVVKVLTLKY